MAKQSLTFGDVLSQWMRTHRLSSSAVAALVGAKSATSISRLRNNQCSAKRCEAFLSELLAATAVAPDEERRFRDALTINQRASADFVSTEAFRRLLFPKERSAENWEMPDMPFLAEAEAVELLCYQPMNAAFCGWLQGLLMLLGERLHVRCMVPSPWPGDTLRFAVEALPLLCDARCSFGALPLQASGTTPLCVLRSQNKGRQREWLLARVPGETLRVLPMPEACGLFDFMLSLAEGATPINRNRPLSTTESCISFLEECYHKEHGAEVCLFQADLCVSFVPPEILQSAMDDVVAQCPAFHDAALDLRRLAYLRFANHREKKKATHLLLSRQALHRFMKTGVTGNHFALMRPFTLMERKTILRQLLELAESNPAFDLRFAREEGIFGPHAFSSFSGSGVLVSPAATDYVHTAGASPYCEAFLADPAFARAFRNYFCETLLGCHALGRAESIAYLRTLTCLN